jgi:hypothetical protein
VALRSYPRRFRALLTAGHGDERPDDVAHRAGPDGRSALDHTEHVARSFGLVGHALHQVLVVDRPVVPAGVVDDEERSWVSAHADAEIADVLDLLEREATELAERIEGTDPGQWTREATVAGRDGMVVSALDLVREAVRTGAEGLRATERTLRAVRA